MYINKIKSISIEIDGVIIDVPCGDSSSAVFQSNNLKKSCPPLYNYLLNHYEKEPNWMGRVWLFYKEIEEGRVTGMKEPPLCEYCGKNFVRFISLNKGYSKYCSNKCSNNDSRVKEKKRKSSASPEKEKENNNIRKEIINGRVIDIPNYGFIHSNGLREVSVKNKCPEFHEYINKTITNGRTWTEKLYMYFHDMTEIPKCPVCGKKNFFIDVYKGFSEHCSRKCSNSVFRFHIPTLENLIKKYGNIKDLCEVDNIPELDNPNPSNLRDSYIIMNYPKFYIYILNNYPHAQSTVERIYQFHHGISEPFKCKYCGNPVKFKSFGQGYQEYCSVKCQTSHIDPEINKKSQKSYCEKTGYTSPLKNPKVREKIKQIIEEKYEVQNIMQNDKVKNKYIQTRRQQFMEKYSLCIDWTDEGDCICKCPHPGECNKCEGIFIISRPLYIEREKVGVEICTVLKDPKNNSVSDEEIRDRSIMENLGIKCDYNSKKIIPPLELDICSKEKVPQLGHKLAIEENGVWCHCLSCDIREMDDEYHMRKWKACYEEDIELIIFWSDFEFEDKRKFIEAKFRGADLNYWKKLWFPDLKDNEWPLDLGWPPTMKRTVKKPKKHFIVREGKLCCDAGIVIESK